MIIFIRKISKIFSLWNRTRKELLFIAALVVLVIHYAFLNNSLNVGSTERVLNELPYIQKAPPVADSCVVPKLNPFAESITKCETPALVIACAGEDWVRCYNSKCNQTDEIQEWLLSPTCEFKDIILGDNKNNLTFGPVSLLREDETYSLNYSDYVQVSCKATNGTDGKVVVWSRNVMALRPVPISRARKESINVLILAFDTLSANGFQRLMPNSWEVLKMTLRATVMKGYSTIGDGIASALLAILTGKTEDEVLDEKRDPKVLHTVQFIYRKLKERGYRTAFFEDAPSKSTFMYRLSFKDQPADHHFYKSILETGTDGQRYCLGDTPEIKLILNLTNQFMDLDGNRFAFTYVADIMKDDFNMAQSADEYLERMLLAYERHRTDTLLVVVSDHGPRNQGVRDSWQGKLEERLPLLALALPRKLMLKRHRAGITLTDNSDVVTTPYDLHATLADVLGMKNEMKLKRGLSLLETIPKNRSCSDAGVEPHWCFCVQWEDVASTDPMFKRTAYSLVHYVNSLLKEVGNKCATRNVTSIGWVLRQIIPRSEDNPNYQIRVMLRPDDATYEATMLHIEKEDRFVIKARHISRTNYHDYVPVCVAESHPHLTPFCRCEY